MLQLFPEYFVSEDVRQTIGAEEGEVAVAKIALEAMRFQLRPETDRAADFPVGSVLYGVPWHVCPTVALYNDAVVVREGRADGRWQVAARARTLSI